MQYDDFVNSAQVQELVGLVTEFKRIMESESTAMKSRSVEALPGIASDKERIVERLQQYEGRLIDLFKDFPDVEVVNDIKQTLESCQQLNRENHSIAFVELRHSRNSLDLLRSLLKLDDLPLYGAGGDLKIIREKRDLGNA